MSLKGRHFLTLKDFTPEEIRYMLDLAKDLKKKKKEGVVEKPLEGKNIALIFEKTSTRPAVLLKLQPTTWEWVLRIWIQRDHRSEKRKALPIQPEY